MSFSEPFRFTGWCDITGPVQNRIIQPLPSIFPPSFNRKYSLTVTHFVLMGPLSPISKHREHLLGDLVVNTPEQCSLNTPSVMKPRVIGCFGTQIIRHSHLGNPTGDDQSPALHHGSSFLIHTHLEPLSAASMTFLVAFPSCIPPCLGQPTSIGSQWAF